MCNKNQKSKPFLRTLPFEMFSKFKEQLDAHYGSVKSNNLYLKSDFQTNTAKIWSEINLFED